MEVLLWSACFNGNIEDVITLLQNTIINTNWQDDEYSRTPFYLACEKGHIEIVKLLLNDKRVDINKAHRNETTPFYIACQEGHIKIVKLLLNDKRVDVNEGDDDGITPFWIACLEGHIDVVELLLEDGRVGVNEGDEDGETPFCIVCQEGFIDLVKLLLNDQRVDINQANEDGRTPFLIACGFGHIEIVKLLLNDDRIDVNKTNNAGYSPIWIACYEGHIEIVELFFHNERVVDFNQTGHDGETPFYVAYERGFIDLVKLLLNNNQVNINKANNDGETPFYIAFQEEHTEVVNVLRNEKNKLNLKDEVERYNQNLQQKKDIISSIGNLRDILLYFSESITLEMKQESIKNIVQSFKNCQEDQKSAFFWVTEKLSLNDELTKIFRDVGGMKILAKSFIQLNQDIQSALLVPIVMIINCNRLFREDLGKNSEFLESLTTLLENDDDDDDDNDLTFSVAGIILSLAGYISNKETIKTALENIIFPISQDDQFSEEDVDLALDYLMEASAIPESKSILFEFGINEKIQPFVDDENSPFHFISCVIQACLSSNDVNQNNELGSNPTSPKVISKILDVINGFINPEVQEYSYKDGYFLCCYHILRALGSLARNEANMKELKNNEIVKKIIEFIQNRMDNLLKTSEKTIEELSTVIWILSFDQDCKDDFLSNGIVEILKGFNVKDNESAKRAVNGALFILTGNQSQNRNEIKRQVMISYCWEEKEKAREVANYLKSKNIPIWIDIEQMEGSILEKMAKIVEESSIILVFLSSKYKDSQACRIEAEYAYKLKKEIICIMAEENYQPRGWLGTLLGYKICYNPWKNLIFDEESFSPILSQLVKLLNQPEMVTQTQENKQDEISKPIQTPQQSTNNDGHQNQNQQQYQQILNLLEKMITKIDGFENRLQKVETQNQENFEKLEQRFGGVETQNKENFEKLEIQTKEKFQKLEQRIKKMETNSEQRFEQMFEKLEKRK